VKFFYRIRIDRIENTYMNKYKQNYIQQLVRISLSSLMLVVVFLTSCNGKDILGLVFPDEGVDQIEKNTQDSLHQPESAITPIPTFAPPLMENISIWLPPQFDPNAETESGKRMLSQIALFQEQNPDFELEIRIKAESGSSSLINSLSAASSVAPSALPSLVLISRSDLEKSAALGLLQPMQQLTSVFDKGDWFSVAEKMSKIHDETYGLSFVLDAIGLIQHNNTIGSTYVPLANAGETLTTIHFSAGSPDTLVPLMFYQSIGGVFTDDKGNMTLDELLINEMLSSFQTYSALGLFPKTLVNYQSEEQSWNAFNTNQVEDMVSWISLPQAEGIEFSVSPVPSIGTHAFTYAEAYVWCLVTQETNAFEPSILFMEHMIDPVFLTDWTPTTKYLPVRPSTLAGWIEPKRESIRTILQSAELLPGEMVLTTIKSDMIKEVQNMILGIKSPEESTLTIMEKLSEDLTNE
jgi:multiple sugar transport system substrate-binding protein